MSDGNKSLPIIDLAYRLTLENNHAVFKLPRHQRPGMGRRLEEAAFDLLAALVKARYLRAEANAAVLSQGSQALDTLRLLVRMAHDLTHLPTSRYEELYRMMGEDLDALLPRARAFLAERLALTLNERKTLLKHTGDGMDFLGYRLFYHHRLLRCKNMKKVRTRMARMARQYAQ